MTKGKRKLEKDDEPRGKTVSHEVVRDRNEWMREYQKSLVGGVNWKRCRRKRVLFKKTKWKGEWRRKEQRSEREGRKENSLNKIMNDIAAVKVFIIELECGHR